jgi:hypothetical protein
VHSVGHSASDTAFKEGRTKTGGRAKGTPNKIGGDLRQMIMNAAVAPASSISLNMASALPLAMRTRTPTGQRQLKCHRMTPKLAQNDTAK